MDLINISHLNTQELEDFNPGILIAASGYEARSISVPKKAENIQCRKVALAFKECTKELSRPDNDIYFKEHGYELITQSGNQVPDYNFLLKNIPDQPLNILFDFSVMTRIWYYGLLEFLHENEDFQNIRLRMIYCPAKYNEPVRLKKRITLRNYSFSENSKSSRKHKQKTALILGLGNELNVSKKVSDLLNPDITFLLYADPAIEKRYVEDVFVSNHSLINTIPIRNLKGYPLSETKRIYDILIDIILPLRDEYTIIMVPQGPKIFSLIAMLFQISYPDIELYYPLYKIKHICNREPYGFFTTIELEFENE